MIDNFLFQHYLVVFFDHLGQRETLRKMTGIPALKTEEKSFIEHTKNSVGRVIQIREAFKDYFDAAKACEPDGLRVRTEDQEEFLASQRKVEVSIYGISDAVVIAVPLGTSDDNCAAVNSVYDALIATCGIGLMSLSVFNIAMRAGLNVGVATKINDNEIYGPALESAFYLESKLAEYPRFLVGKELISYLQWVENQPCGTRIGQAAKEIARICRALIIQDADGRYMLDFLGAKIREVSANIIDQDFVAAAFQFVNAQHQKYIKEENEILSSRYFRLLRYFQARKGIWGIN
ncbi:MAG: hypothetical protein EPN25_07450 [Nitrospirae bacterium]|nr:MAG: hypothetical protein EPN25_07450 [Nitrospirota bacterium]